MKKFNEVKKERLLKEGRGQGTGKDYKPWMKISDYSSKGRATRIMGIKTGRIHHLQSDNQLRAFLIYEFSNKVFDIRESYPLLDVMEVIDNQEDLRFDRFRSETEDQYVLTTTFLLTIKDSNQNETLVARTIKNQSELNKRITFEKLEIERRYWEAKGVDWRIVTDKELPKQVATNILWVRETLLDENSEIDKEELSQILMNYFVKNSDMSIKELLKLFEQSEGVTNETGLYLLRYLIAKQEISLDFTKKIDLAIKVKDLLLK
ncbi:heteromeric transposase endonuclease subunit TnsA [Tepidibacillus sp. HK-1]|uniref:heteromeric transposase endonuclease subunit TnsA n=1 Tax=Tepidibacillus sp. HK-1 TaxID=1883407 RepID=UPI000853A62D|nr:heteromeric transposase endonuclease subunit TnsA [Tepidibacillus sp. HK-1]GBF12606.1 transposon Tn7 transposition protein TnsA [Tepidibacillus sp. HK-1]